MMELLRSRRFQVAGMAAVGIGLLLAGQTSRVAIVVLGNSDIQHAVNRVGTAAWLARQYQASRVITSGKGAGISGQPEATWMAGALKQLGIPNVEEEPFSTNTSKNVVNSAAMLTGWKERVFVVSDHWHVESAAWCLRWKHGLDAYWVQWPDHLLPVYPAYHPINCDRAGCCG